MSQQLINRSGDLKRLRDEGYDVEVRANHLLVKNVPYVNSRREIKSGILVSTLNVAGDVTVRPDTHVAHFSGEHPCNKDGTLMVKIQHQSVTSNLGEGLEVHHSFSSKPQGGYENYYDKMVAYIAMISTPAHSLDSSVKPQTFPVIEQAEDESVFRYIDSASSRAGINAVSNKLALSRIAIVGVGGTGSYILDLVAKTPVQEIHLFDGDTFLTHNAFRAPGAASVEELRLQPRKVDFYRDKYSAMRRNIFAHDCFLDESNLDLLNGMDFVFLCLDTGEAKNAIIRHLESAGIPFVDVGIGVQLVDDSLLGIVRTTFSSPEKRDHIRENKRISFEISGVNNEYETNIQVADLNALNAALAVIRWKKYFGFYLDLEGEHHCTYTIDGNHLLSEDKNK